MPLAGRSAQAVTACSVVVALLATGFGLDQWRRRARLERRLEERTQMSASERISSFVANIEQARLGEALDTAGEEAMRDPRWVEVRDRVIQNYRGFSLSPQRGLRPLGRNPATGLEEFLVIGTGDASPRGPAALDSTPDTGLVLILLPACPEGFEMGGNGYHDQEPIHLVRIRQPFFLAATETTKAMMLTLMGETVLDAGPTPVTEISWEGAKNLCSTLGLRLPTEAEWEYACRAGTTSHYWSGETEEDLARVGWYAGNSQGVQPVALKSASGWGLHDVHGNVWEWCEDKWHASYIDAASDERARVDGVSGLRVLRGGSFAHSAVLAQSSFRGWNHPSGRWLYVGFRAARSVTP